MCDAEVHHHHNAFITDHRYNSYSILQYPHMNPHVFEGGVRTLTRLANLRSLHPTKQETCLSMQLIMIHKHTVSLKLKQFTHDIP